MKRQRFSLVIFVLLMMSLPSVPARGDLQQLIAETQRLEQFNGGFRIIWWIPTAYWRESFKNSSMTPARADAVCKTLDDYLIVAATDVNIGPMGGITPVPGDQVVAKLSAKINDEETMKPLDASALTPDVKNLLDMMKPAMANMLGKFGSGLEFLCFPAKDAGGKQVLDPKQPGMLTLIYGDKSYKIRLPLGSLLPAKYDPQTGEKFMGNYIYSPFTGAKLVDSPPADKS